LPYFLWWTDLTIGDFKHRLSTGTAEERAYYMGALLREANSRDVWLFVTPTEVREAWPQLLRHLGRSRAMWAWLLGMPDVPWPPAERLCVVRSIDESSSVGSSVADQVEVEATADHQSHVRA